MDDQFERTVHLLLEYQKVTEQAIALLRQKTEGTGSDQFHPSGSADPFAFQESTPLPDSMRSIKPFDPVEVVDFAILRREEIIGQLKELISHEGRVHKEEAVNASSETSTEQARIDLLLDQITALETEFVHLLHKLQRDAGEKLAQIRKGKTLRDQYTQTYIPTEGGFIDRRVGRKK